MTPGWDLRRPHTLRRHMPPAAADVDEAMRGLLDREGWDVGDRERAVRLLVETACAASSTHPHCSLPDAARARSAYSKSDRDARIAELAETLSVGEIAERTGLSRRQVARILRWRRPTGATTIGRAH